MPQDTGALVAAIKRIQDEASTVCGDWRETASMIDSICIAILAKVGAAVCWNCAGEGLVCENHQAVPWVASGHSDNCGAGALCPVCCRS